MPSTGSRRATRGPAAKAVVTLRAAVERALRSGTAPIGVACSGGADSLALADAAIAVAGAARVVVITVDHGLVRGSAKVAARVAEWAREQGARAEVRAVTVTKRASLEAAAREARYAALAEVAAELGLAQILLGHTARDQAETVLFRIIRGTGPAGLAGIPAIRDLYARPLLALPRAAIDAYVHARNLHAWHDPMNADRRYARTRVRASILPALRTENPAIEDALCRLAAAAREWTEVLDAAAAPHARFPIDCTVLAALPAAVRKRALSLALDRAGIAHDQAHVDAVDALAIAPAQGTVALDLPKIRATRTYNVLDLAGSEPASAPVPATPAGHELRPWRPGDRMRPQRLKGRSRKLSDLYVDAKVPRAIRAAARVLVRVEDGEIVWAEHVGHSVDVPTRSGGNF